MITRPHIRIHPRGRRNTLSGSSFFSGILKQRASISKTVTSLYIFALRKYCSRLYRLAICLSALKLAAVRSTSLKYRLVGKTKRSQPCLSSISFAMRVHHGGRSDEEGSISVLAAECPVLCMDGRQIYLNTMPKGQSRTAMDRRGENSASTPCPGTRQDGNRQERRQLCLYTMPEGQGRTVMNR